MRALLALLAFMTVAHAEPGDEPKSAEAATWTSVGVTAGGVAALVGVAASHDPGQRSALMSVGALAILGGPSIGHFYAHDAAMVGLGFRSAGLTVAVLAESFGSICTPTSHDCHFSNGPSPAALVTAGVLALVGTVFDLATTPAVVDRYNASLVVAPVQARDGVAPGLAFAGRF